MKKFLGIMAATVLVGVSGAASAADSQNESSANQPAELNGLDMDTVTAGTGGATGTYTRTINLGSYRLVFNGTTWTRVKN